MSRVRPFSAPDSWMSGCSPLQTRNLPLSSMVGVNRNVDIVTLPSELVYRFEKELKKKMVEMDETDESLDLFSNIKKEYLLCILIIYIVR